MAVQDVLNQLTGLGTGAASPAPAFDARINAHIHLPPNFSAFETVEQAVDLARGQRIGALGASNYYDYEVYGDFGALALKSGIYPLFGLEIIAMSESLKLAGAKVNDPGNPGKIYICGKGITRFDPMSAEAARLLGLIRGNDSRRMAAMAARLAEVLSGTASTPGSVRMRSSSASSGATSARGTGSTCRSGTSARPSRSGFSSSSPRGAARSSWRKYSGRPPRAVLTTPSQSRTKSART